MIALLESYDRLVKSASQGFLLRAFFPWVFVIVLNIAIYETLIPDGRSLIDWFAGLSENLQIYAALAVVIAIAAIAGVSDGVVDLFVSPFRFSKLRASAAAASARTNLFAAEFLKRLVGSRHANAAGSGVDVLALALAKVDEAETAVHRSVILVIGFAISIWLNAIELARYQTNIWTSVKVVVVLWLLMAGSSVLAALQIRTLIVLDRLVGELVTAAKPRQRRAVRKDHVE